MSPDTRTLAPITVTRRLHVCRVCRKARVGLAARGWSVGAVVCSKCQATHDAVADALVGDVTPDGAA